MEKTERDWRRTVAIDYIRFCAERKTKYLRQGAWGMAGIQQKRITGMLEYLDALDLKEFGKRSCETQELVVSYTSNHPNDT